MSSTFVTLAEVLESRGGPLVEEEVWSLLLGTAESLVDVSFKSQSMCNIISPTSLLLSATGTLAFKNCALSDEVSTFTAPEMLHNRGSSTKPTVEKMQVYSLGMTLYWAVDYHLPQNQPVQLSDHLNCLLLSMCEDLAHRRVTLNSVLEACESQHKASLLPPPNKVIRHLVENVFHDSVERGARPDSLVPLSGRSQMIRERLHGKRGPFPDFSEAGASAGERRRYSEDSDDKSGSLPHRPWRQKTRGSPTHSYSAPSTDRLPRALHHRDSSTSSWLCGSTFLDPPSKAEASPQPPSPSISFSESSISLTQRRAKALGPEFVRMADEQQIVLELPGSIVSKKGRSCASQREVSVVLPSGQIVAVRCDIKSRGRDVFDMVVAHANLVEHFYFGLAFLDDDEYFFLDHETKISKVAPDSWKKVQMASFLVFLRVKFFVDDISFILHKLTRHQYYLQLRKDILEDKLYCNEETGMFLAALALQAEFGNYMPELYGRNYYRPEHYVSKRMLEKMALPTVNEELPRLHAIHAQMLPEEAETEYLKIAQQLPEYGVMFHRVGRERKPVVGELVLGVCAKGVIVYETKNHIRTVSRRFLWRETDSISTGRKKLTIECGGPSGKKHSFVTESSKIAQYLLALCSSQHKFHSEMTSRQLNHSAAQDENIEKYLSICRAQNSHMKRMSCSEGGLHLLGLAPGQRDSISKSCDNLTARMEERLSQQRELRREMSQELPPPRPLRDIADSPSWSHRESISRVMSSVSLQKPDSDVSISISPSTIRVDTPTRTPPEREIICLTLKKDPKLGFGFVLVGEDNTGKLDLGIFIASIVPDGPADKDGRIRPGGRLISLNKISLEGVTFTDAAAILQSSPDEVELIVSQAKYSFRDSRSSLTPSTLGLMLERGFGSQTTLSGTEFRPAVEELEEALTLSNMATPKQGRKLLVPVVRILDPKDVFSRSPSVCSLRTGEQLQVELKKRNGSLGISVAGGVNTNVRFGGIYIKSLVPGGAAEEDGRVQLGDRLLEVDGNNLRGVTHREAVECLKRTREVVSLVLEREPTVVLEPWAESPCPPCPPSTLLSPVHPPRTQVSMETSLKGRVKDYSFVTDDNTMEVVLRKSLCGLGFSFFITELATESDRGSVVRIKRLFYGQPALESGQIQEGDVILAVNGEPVKDLSYQSVLFLLRGAPSDVCLLICRPPPGTLSEIQETLSPAPRARECRSKSLDIRLGADYSQLLKFRYDVTQPSRQTDQIKEEEADPGSEAERPPDPPDTHTVTFADQTHAPSPLPPPPFPSSPPSPTSPPSPLTPTSPSSPLPRSPLPPLSPVGPMPPSPASFPSPPPPVTENSEKPEEEKTADEEVSKPTSSTVERIGRFPKRNSHPVFASGIREEADGSLTYCLMGDGLTILADEEYLTISSTMEHRRRSTLPSHSPSTAPGPGVSLPPPSTTTIDSSLSSSTLPSKTSSTQPPTSDSRPLAPPSQPPASAQVVGSTACGPGTPAPPQSPTAPAAPAASTKHAHAHWKDDLEERERKDNDYNEDEEDDDEDPGKGKHKEFELSVMLTKSRNGSFGFTITRSKLDNCYYIQDILDNPARSDGRLRSGDRLIRVNGHDVTDVGDEFAMSLLRSSHRKLGMTLGRAVTNLVAPSSCDSFPDVFLYKTPSGQLGIKLTGGIGSKWQGIYCLEVVPGSPASEEGTVQPNDKILYICGRCTMGMTLEDAVKACELAPRKVKLKVTRDDQPVAPKNKWNGLFEWKKDRKFFARFEEPPTPEEDSPTEEADTVPKPFRQRLSQADDQDSCILQVEFTKPDGGGLGFALIGGANGSALRVKDICSGGVAEQDGRLRVGDVLLEVNGVIVSGLSHGKVVDILRKAEGSVQLTICRDILPLASLANMATKPTAPNPECPPASPDAKLTQPASQPQEIISDPDLEDVFTAHASCASKPATAREDQDFAEEETCSSTPSTKSCCPSLSVSSMLHGASGRNPPPIPQVEKLRNDSRNSKSDGWSSEEEEDMYEPNGHAVCSPSSGPPLVSEDELASLAVIRPPNTSQYSGSRVKALIRVLHHQLDQQELLKEFMALEHLKPSDNCLVGKAPENREKNRYRDILPYDKTRVPIGENQDYINASYIRMEVDTEKFCYISCQGPLPATVPAFWQMVWENKSDVIAMMTQEVERGRVKCHKYWPERVGVPLSTDRYELTLENHQNHEYFHIKIIRMLEKQTGEVHRVRHLKFTRWPDHGVPRSSEQLVRFLRYLRAVHHQGPVTVHCSAGIGRTGVLICTDVIVSLIENDLPINVSDIVRDMRLQRYGMIQTKEQYLFCYKVWLEVLQGILQLDGSQWCPDSPLNHKVV